MAKHKILKEFLHFIKHEKLYWLIPLFVIMSIVVFLLVFAQSSPLAPFLYPLF